MSSRLCVKGLPKHTTEAELRKVFSVKGEETLNVTDAKVARTKDGASRQFGFVGFRTTQEAEEAVRYFNNTFMGTQRISVEFAEQRGANGLNRPWSKYSQGSTANKRLTKAPEPPKLKAREAKKLAKQKRLPENPAEDDPKLQEFLRLMAPRKATAIWSNDDVALAVTSAPPTTVLPKQATQPGELPKKAMQHVPMPKEATQGAEREEPGDSEDDDLYEELPAKGKGHNKAGRGGSAWKGRALDGLESKAQQPDPTVLDDTVSDLAYLRSRMKATLDDDEEDEEDGDGGDGSDETDDDDDSDVEDEDAAQPKRGGVTRGDDSDESSLTDTGEDGKEGEEGEEGRRNSHKAAGPRQRNDDGGEGDVRIEDTGRLFLRNLPYTATEAELAALLGPYGELSEVHLAWDKHMQKSRGFALARFAEAESAVAAHAALDGSIFQGRLLHVLPGREAPAPKQPVDEAAAGKAGATSFKAQREAGRRDGAGKRTAWNTLFMRADTITQAAAALLGISVSELMNPEAEDLATRLAQGEVLVLRTTKAALAEAGVAVEALEAAAAAGGHAAVHTSVPRSPSTLLVKNLPYSASEDKLLDMFSKVGALARLVLPPTHTLALVEFLDAADARRAFASLAYKRFEGVPLYLEWAPEGVFLPDAPTLISGGLRGDSSALTDADPTHASTTPMDLVQPEEADAALAESSTLYVKNLAFTTTDAALQRHFDAAISAAGGNVRAARVSKKKGPDGKPLSAGFGFVECSSESVARLVLKKLQGSVLEGHKLVLQLSMRKGIADKKGSSATAEDKKMAKGTKLVVRNVAFEATKKDIQSLFAGFGQIRSVRLPRKFDHNHRGFAFVDFLTKQEALNAKEAVTGAHLYGRRLVIEWAAPDEGLDELRAKTAAKSRAQDVDLSMPIAKRFRLAKEN